MVQNPEDGLSNSPGLKAGRLLILLTRRLGARLDDSGDRARGASTRPPPCPGGARFSHRSNLGRGSLLPVPPGCFLGTSRIFRVPTRAHRRTSETRCSVLVFHTSPDDRSVGFDYRPLSVSPRRPIIPRDVGVFSFSHGRRMPNPWVSDASGYGHVWGGRPWTLRIDAPRPGLKAERGEHGPLLALDSISARGRGEPTAQGASLVGHETRFDRVESSYAPDGWGSLRVRAGWTARGNDVMDLEVQVQAFTVGDLQEVEVHVASLLGSAGVEELRGLDSMALERLREAGITLPIRSDTSLPPLLAKFDQVSGDSSYYLELIHPDDGTRRTLNRARGEVRYALFGHDLEREGVVVRGGSGDLVRSAAGRGGGGPPPRRNSSSPRRWGPEPAPGALSPRSIRGRFLPAQPRRTSGAGPSCGRGQGRGGGSGVPRAEFVQAGAGQVDVDQDRVVEVRPEAKPMHSPTHGPVEPVDDLAAGLSWPRPIEGQEPGKAGLRRTLRDGGGIVEARPEGRAASRSASSAAPRHPMPPG